MRVGAVELQRIGGDAELQSLGYTQGRWGRSAESPPMHSRVCGLFRRFSRSCAGGRLFWGFGMTSRTLWKIAERPGLPSDSSCCGVQACAQFELRLAPLTRAVPQVYVVSALYPRTRMPCDFDAILPCTSTSLAPAVPCCCLPKRDFCCCKFPVLCSRGADPICSGENLNSAVDVSSAAQPVGCDVIGQWPVPLLIQLRVCFYGSTFFCCATLHSRIVFLVL